MDKKLSSPTTYQGGKQRIAGQILDIIKPKLGTKFFDLCCGSGAISVELVNRGYQPKDIHMVDIGPWGIFWKMVGDGTFEIEKFQKYCDLIPKRIELIQGFLQELSKTPADIDTAYVFLLLQSGSFGGKAIWIKDNKWVNCSFRNYWLPTPTSSRRSPVNPMMPMPHTLLERTREVCHMMLGVKGEHNDIFNISIPSDSIVYVDPPYKDTTFYSDEPDIEKFIDTVLAKCYISESYPLSSNAVRITSARKKGGISGERKSSNEEWLSRVK